MNGRLKISGLLILGSLFTPVASTLWASACPTDIRCGKTLIHCDSPNDNMPCTYQDLNYCDQQKWSVKRDSIKFSKITYGTEEECDVLKGFDLDVTYPLGDCPFAQAIPYSPDSNDHVIVKLVKLPYGEEFSEDLGQAPNPSYAGASVVKTWTLRVKSTPKFPAETMKFESPTGIAEKLDSEYIWALEVELSFGTDREVTGRKREVLEPCTTDPGGKCEYPTYYEQLKDFEIKVVDSQNCPPCVGNESAGSSCSNVAQDVRNSKYYGGSKDCYYQFCITVEGVVERQNGPYDFICVDEPGGPPCTPSCKGFYFGGYEDNAGCPMATRQMQKVITIYGDTAELNYNTVDQLYHTDAYAKIINVEFVKSWKGQPPNQSNCTEQPSEPCLPECYSPGDCGEAGDYGTSTNPDPAHKGEACRCIPCEEKPKTCDMCKTHLDCKKMGQKVDPKNPCGCVPCDRCPPGEGPNLDTTEDKCDCKPCAPCELGYRHDSSDPYNPCRCVPCGEYECAAGSVPGPECTCTPCTNECSPGEIYDTPASCHCGCPEGHNYQNGGCINGTVPDPTTENVCDCRCPAGSDKGTDDICPEGQADDFTTGNACDCVCPETGTDEPDCEPGQEADPTTPNRCDCHCPPGSDLGDGTCPDGMSANADTDDVCDCSCPDGSHGATCEDPMVKDPNNECACICGPNTDVGGPGCKGSEVVDENNPCNCKCLDCPEGTHRKATADDPCACEPDDCKPPPEGCGKFGWKGEPECACGTCDKQCPEGQTVSDQCECVDCEPQQCEFGMDAYCNCLPCPPGTCVPPCPPIDLPGLCYIIEPDANGCPVARPLQPPANGCPQGTSWDGCGCVPNPTCDDPGCDGCTQWEGMPTCQCVRKDCPGKYCRCVHGECQTNADKPPCPCGYARDAECKCPNPEEEAHCAPDERFNKETCACEECGVYQGRKARCEENCGTWANCTCNFPNTDCPECQHWEIKSCACVNDTPPECGPCENLVGCKCEAKPDPGCDPACQTPNADCSGCDGPSPCPNPSGSPTDSPNPAAAQAASASASTFALLSGFKTLGAVMSVGSTPDTSTQMEGLPLPEPVTIQVNFKKSVQSSPQSVFIKAKKGLLERLFRPQLVLRPMVDVPVEDQPQNPQLYRKVSDKRWIPLPGTYTGSALIAVVYHYGFYQVFTPIVGLPFSFGEVYVYPNPSTKGNVPTLHAEVGAADKVTTRVYDISGDLVFEARIDANHVVVNGKPAYEYMMDPNRFKSGVYNGVVTAEKAGKDVIRKKFKFTVVK